MPDTLSQQLVLTPMLQMAIRVLGSDHRALVAVIDDALAADPHLIQLEPPAPVGEADLALALEPDRAWVEVAPWGRYETRDGAGREATFLVRALEKRAETVASIVRVLAEHHRTKLDGTGPTEPMSVRDLASALGIHPSSVARVLADKTVRFEREVVALEALLPTRR